MFKSKTFRTAAVVAAIAPTPILCGLVACGLVSIKPTVQTEHTEVLEPIDVVQYRNVDVGGRNVSTHNLDCGAVKHDDLVCLTCNIYEESRNQPLAGQILVAKTTLNRAMAGKQSICKTVWENKQFSWTNDVTGAQDYNQRVQESSLKHKVKVTAKNLMKVPMKQINETDSWRKALEVAHLVMREYGLAKANDVNVVVMADGQANTDIKWYHTQAVSPEWRKSLKQTDVVGDHVFYKNS